MVKLKGFQKLTSTDDALRKWFGAMQTAKPTTVLVPLDEALNRILAENIVPDESLPRFDRSAMDGYAVNAEATAGASQFKPAHLSITESNILDAKQAKQIWTGNPIPKGANAVVMIENTQKRSGGELEVWTQMAPGDNVVKKGEDLQKGETAIEAGTRLNPYHVGLLAALGKTHVNVTEKPKIAILATGNELAAVGTKPEPHQVYDSNRVMVAALCRELGAEPVDLGIVGDDVDAIADRIQIGLRRADAVITTGGTSVGGLDLVPDSVNKLGKPGIVIHGIAMRPGMPTALAQLEEKPVMVLSGNPVAAIIGFEVFARPLICRLLGMKKEEPRQWAKATITRRVSSALGRKTFVRVRAFEKNGEIYAEPVSAKGSGAISTMTRANGFVVIPEDREGLAEGDSVTVRLFGNVEKEKGHV